MSTDGAALLAAAVRAAVLARAPRRTVQAVASAVAGVVMRPAAMGAKPATETGVPQGTVGATLPPATGASPEELVAALREARRARRRRKRENRRKRREEKPSEEVHDDATTTDLTGAVPVVHEVRDELATHDGDADAVMATPPRRTLSIDDEGAHEPQPPAVEPSSCQDSDAAVALTLEEAELEKFLRGLAAKRGISAAKFVKDWALDQKLREHMLQRLSGGSPLRRVVKGSPVKKGR